MVYSWLWSYSWLAKVFSKMVFFFLHVSFNHSCFMKTLFGGPCSAYLTSHEEDTLFLMSVRRTSDVGVPEEIVLSYAPWGCSTRMVFSYWPGFLRDHCRSFTSLTLEVLSLEVCFLPLRSTLPSKLSVWPSL